MEGNMPERTKKSASHRRIQNGLCYNAGRGDFMDEEKAYDCIIAGAGPGGLQAAIYLGRFNRSVLLLDKGGGRTYHARHIENFLTQKVISGKEMIETGFEHSFFISMIPPVILRNYCRKRKYYLSKDGRSE
jgi:flavin-dependent dehydrogenase